MVSQDTQKRSSRRKAKGQRSPTKTFESKRAALSCVMIAAMPHKVRAASADGEISLVRSCEVLSSERD